jgi:hypothetical protein
MNFGLVVGTWLNWRPGRALREKWRQLVEKVREWYVASRYLQVCSPFPCRLRTDGFTPVSKYWTYRSHAGDIGLINLVAYRQHMFYFLHCFVDWLGRETRYGPTDQSADVLWIVSGALFIRSSDSVQRCQRLAEGCYVLTVWYTYGLRPYADWAWKVCGVLVGFSPAGCTSIQIVVILGYE